ncbi:MAG: hypothetical protein IPF60_16995 [Betaproteobacteria bacterium]|nr:hypothetical protein [Betaproteobacteria bacterium]
MKPTSRLSVNARAISRSWFVGRGELSLLADYCGYYPVYRSESAPMVSSSLLALAAVESNRRIDTQAMYEYLLHGFFVGEETLIEGVRRLDSRKLWQLSPVIAGASRMPAFDPLPVARGLDEVVETVSAELRHYFAMLSSLFPGISARRCPVATIRAT